MDEAEKELGIFVKNREKGDILKIETDQGIYEMKIINPENREVKFTNGCSGNILSNTEGVIIGSSLTGRGTMVKLGWIAENYLLCLWVKGVGEIHGFTKKVWVNGRQLGFYGREE